MTNRFRTALFAFAAFAGQRATASAQSSPQRSAPSLAGYDAQVVDGIKRLRAATQAFQNLDSAIAAGYPAKLPECLIHAEHGAMGYHHVNSTYVDAKLEIEHPEILLYERMADSSYRLNGVEFIVPYRAWPRDSVAPVLMGQKLAHEDNLKIWYLHVWAWTNNRDGLFTGFNPDVQCRNGTGKVYTPFAAP